MHRRAVMFTACLLAGALVAAPSFADPVPVPADKAAYVGDWRGRDMRIHLKQDGHVDYARKQPGKNLNLNVDVGFSLVRSTFVVSKPPHREGGKWKMTVDGVELTRVE
jgi:hypothetical protein